MFVDRMLIFERVKEQWGDQLLHFLAGFFVTWVLSYLVGPWAACIAVAMAWIIWEHAQYPHLNSKGYDDGAIDRIFQELGILGGLIAHFA